MSKLNNEPFLNMIAEMEGTGQAIQDWRSFPPDHPFYIEGERLEGRAAALAEAIHESNMANRNDSLLDAPASRQ